MCRRMEEVKRNEQRATVEDLMYASVLEKFVEVGVDMMPTLDSITESQETLKVWAACFHVATLEVVVTSVATAACLERCCAQ